MAMPNRNVHEIVGHIGREPELKYTSTGEFVCFLPVATSNYQKQGEVWMQKEPEWHIVVLFGELAELVATEFKKGDAIMVRGKHKTRTEEWNGQTRQVGEIIAMEVYRPIYPKRRKDGQEEQVGAPF